MEKHARFQLVYLVFALLGVLFLRDLWVAYRAVETIPYSDFRRLVREDKITDVVVHDDTIEGSYKQAHEGHQRFLTRSVEQGLLIGELLGHVFYSRLCGGSRLLGFGKRLAGHRSLLPLTIQLCPQLIDRGLGPLGFGTQPHCDPQARE
jgi:hypothetical protein